MSIPLAKCQCGHEASKESPEWSAVMTLAGRDTLDLTMDCSQDNCFISVCISVDTDLQKAADSRYEQLISNLWNELPR